MSHLFCILPSKLRLPQLKNGLSIDCGSVLTKLLYDDRVTMKGIVFHSFLTYDLEKNLRLLSIDQMNGPMNEPGTVYITGTYQLHAKSVVMSIFNSAVILMEELEALERGFRFLMENVDEKEILSDTNLQRNNEFNFEVDNELMRRFSAAIRSAIGDQTVSDDSKIKTPAIVMWVGIYVKFYLLGKDASLKLISTSYFGGNAFMGLGKILIDTNNYGEIIDLASQGNRANVDTQIFEMFSQDSNSPYGMIPQDLPIFSFGKCGDQNVGTEICSKEDLMASLSHFIFGENIFSAIQLCQAYKTGTLYVCGNTFSGSVFHRHMMTREKMMFGTIKIRQLDCSYLPALGALID